MPKPVPDLRTSTVTLDVTRIPNLQSLRESAEKNWNIRRIQSFFPSLEELFKFETIRTPYQFGIRLKKSIQTIGGSDTVYVDGVEIPVHRKTTMILPAFQVMRGEFGTSGLPCEKETAPEEFRRIQSPHNAAYVGALASIILSESECIHFPLVFGTFSGIAVKHSIDISDDYEELSERPWFLPNLGHFFDLKLRALPAITLGEETTLVAEELSAPSHTTSDGESDTASLDMDTEEHEIDSVSTSYVFAVHTCSSDGSDHEEGVGFQEEDEQFAEAIFHDVPVQTTVMQKCEGTLYELFKNNVESFKRVAWIAQVVFALTFAQRTFGFVHNDLHVNNVMYVSTAREYLYYNVGGKQYRVPTYGYVLKIIDFDRSTFSVKLPGMRDARFFMSNQFDQEEEAGGQYNIEPFYNPKYAQIKPNASFDLVRLATSLFWDCFPLGPLCNEYSADPLFRILMQWTTLPDGTSILFRDLATKDTHERYEGFHLYKAITRYCKSTAVPRTQVEKLGTPYLFMEKIPSGETCLVVEN